MTINKKMLLIISLSQWFYESFTDNAWKEWPHIWHNDVSQLHSEQNKLWQRFSDLPSMAGFNFFHVFDLHSKIDGIGVLFEYLHF